MLRTLILTSPAMAGPDVVSMQRLLMGLDGSHYHAWDGPPNGIYGQHTADAAYHAKYITGVPLDELDRKAGDTLRGLLHTPPTELPEDYQVRRQQRLHPSPKAPRILALERAASQIGVTESPAGSNLQPFGEWYGENGVAWCAIFDTWASEPYEPATFVKGERYAYVPAIYRDALAHQHGLSLVTSPIPGDRVLYFWVGYHVDETQSHIGIIESGNAEAWVAIEGNTVPDGATGSQGNGGEVCRRHRTRQEAVDVFFVRVNP